MGPKRVYRYKKAWRGVRCRVIGPVYTLDAIAKPLPYGTVLTGLGEYGFSKGERVIAFRRFIPAKREEAERRDWVRRKDLVNPSLVSILPRGEHVQRPAVRRAMMTLARFAPVTTSAS